MYREIAVTTLIAAPLIASAAAHFAPRGGMQRDERTEAAAPQDHGASASMATPDMPAPPPAASEPPALDGAPSLDPVASVDPDAIAATRFDGVAMPTQGAPTTAREEREEAQSPRPGEAERY